MTDRRIAAPEHRRAVALEDWLALVLRWGVLTSVALVVAGTDAITPSVNEIGLVCEGDVLTPYVNGTQLRRRQEKLHVLSEGRIGIAAASFESAPLTISYDRISVAEP